MNEKSVCVDSDKKIPPNVYIYIYSYIYIQNIQEENSKY